MQEFTELFPVDSEGGTQERTEVSSSLIGKLELYHRTPDQRPP